VTSSYNGWPASSDPAAIGIDRDFAVSGVEFPGGVRAGDVATVLGYVIRQIDARVEALVPGWCWGYEYRANVNNPSTMSCHASGTAVDYNAPNHPNGTSTGSGGGGGWTGDQYAEINRILAEVDHAVDWLTSNDPMHFEIDADAAELARVAASLPGNEDEMALSDDDKAWIKQTITDALIKTESVSTDDAAAEGNPNKYTIAGGIARAIRLTSLSYNEQTGNPDR
jgi:hypothetical protein